MKRWYQKNNLNNSYEIFQPDLSTSIVYLESTNVNQYYFPILVNNNVQEDTIKLAEEKMRILRKIRDNLIINTIWVMERHNGETEGKKRGITNKNTTLTEEKFNSWLLYWEALRDLPENIELGAYTLQQIKDMICFPTIPDFN